MVSFRTFTETAFHFPDRSGKCADSQLASVFVLRQKIHDLTSVRNVLCVHDVIDHAPSFAVFPVVWRAPGAQESLGSRDVTAQSGCLQA